MLSACGVNPTLPVSVPVSTYPATYPASLEYGRVTNIEYFPGGTVTSGINVPGAIVGGVAGAVVGNTLSGGRDAATVLGGAAGAAIGSQVGRTQTPVGASPVYRVTIQTDAGGLRTYDVANTGDLRPGDRVRVENGVIYRS
jgi:outer membrane lipoprotein SlyB